MKKIGCERIIYSIFTPYPETEAFDFCRTNSMIPENFDVSLYNHQSPANCFTMNIEPQRFRRLAAKIEKMIDRMNKRTALRRILSQVTLRRICELGLWHGLRKGIKSLIEWSQM